MLAADHFAVPQEIASLAHGVGSLIARARMTAEPAAALGAEVKPSLQWLSAVLDELDYGILLVDAAGCSLYANHAAWLEVGMGSPLRLVGGALNATAPGDAAALNSALAGAIQMGRRRLLILGGEARRVIVSVVPLTTSGSACAPALVMLGKPAVCESLSIESYARLNGLTNAETKVLDALCQGKGPLKIAREFGVAISTIRSQIGSLRMKTGAACVRDVLRQIAMLPPIRSVLRLERKLAERTVWRGEPGTPIRKLRQPTKHSPQTP
jgi:hypothetical protein